MDKIKFIHKEDIPPDRRRYYTYGWFVCKARLEKTKEPNRTRLTAGGKEKGKALVDMILLWLIIYT